jgi:hypothetical protein
LVGALCGVVFFLGENNVVYPGAVYIIWQPAVAFCIGLGMGRAAGKVSCCLNDGRQRCSTHVLSREANRSEGGAAIR